MGRNHCGCRSKCNCQRSRKIVHPVREEVKNRYTEERVRHIHPSHTRVINHHTIRNEHSYPHSTSYENRVNEVNVGGAADRPCNNDVRGEMSDRHNCHRHKSNKCESRPSNCCHHRRRNWW